MDNKNLFGLTILILIIVFLISYSWLDNFAVGEYKSPLKIENNTSLYCTDTDSNTYPTININLKGIVTSQAGSETDYCEDGLLKEKICMTKYSTIISTRIYECPENTICVNGECVSNQTNETHWECWHGQCREFQGAGPNECVSDSECAMCSDLGGVCCTFKKDCEGLLISGSNDCPDSCCSGTCKKDIFESLKPLLSPMNYFFK